MFDFTYLFLVFLMVLAMQSNQPLVAIAMFVILLVMAKSKWLVGVALVGGILSFIVGSGGMDPVVVGGGLLLIVVLLLKSDSGAGSGMGGMGPTGYPMGY